VVSIRDKVWETARESEKDHLDSFVDLLSKMLTLNPAARITAEQALHHPFLKIDLAILNRV